MHREPHFLANLTFMPPYMVGKPPINLSFKAELDLAVSGMKHMAAIELEPQPLGEHSTPSRIVLLCPEFQTGRLHPGKELAVYSGPQLLAKGVITAVTDAVLRA